MLLLVTMALAATTPAALSGPSAADIATAIHAADPQVSGPVAFRTDTIRSLHCRAFEEEPTEYLCRFQAWATEGRWKRRSAIMALDRDGWVLLSLD